MPTVNNVIYTIEDGSVTVGLSPYLDDYNALGDNTTTLSHVAIASHVSGYPVLRIGERAFRHSHIESIWIPRTVEFLQFDCFAYINELLSVEFEDGSQLKELGQGVFFCSPKIKILRIPSKIQSIKSYVFDGTKLDILYFYGRVEINGNDIFTNLYPTIPKNIYVCKNVHFDHIGEVTTLQKNLDCSSQFAMNTYLIKHMSILKHWKHFFCIVLFSDYK